MKLLAKTQSYTYFTPYITTLEQSLTQMFCACVSY